MIFIIGGRAQGKQDFALKLNKDIGYNVMDNYQDMIRKEAEAGLDPIEEARRRIDLDPDIIIISNEVGMGVVPIDKKERELRDIIGRTHTYIAGRAEQVYRVTCGIGQRIK